MYVMVCIRHDITYAVSMLVGICLTLVMLTGRMLNGFLDI